LHEIRDDDGPIAAEIDSGFLVHDLYPIVALERIVRVDDAADAVLELGDDLAAAVVGGGVGGEEDEDVDVETDRVAADLDVALFEDVEEADLDQLVQLRQFVDGENAAVHAGDEAEMEGFFGGHAHAAHELGGVDLADDVGEFCAGGEALGVAVFAAPPADGAVVFVVVGDEE